MDPLLDLLDQNPEGSGSGLLYIFKGSRDDAGMQPRKRTTVLRDPQYIFSPPLPYLWGGRGKLSSILWSNVS